MKTLQNFLGRCCAGFLFLLGLVALVAFLAAVVFFPVAVVIGYVELVRIFWRWI